MKLSIRNKILAGFGLFLIFALAVPSISFLSTQSYIKTQVSNSLYEKTLQASKEIASLQTKIEIGNQSIADVYNKSTEETQEDVYTVIDYNFRQNSYLHQISILNLSGREIIKVDRFRRFTEEKLFFEIPTQSFKDALQSKTGISKVYFVEANPNLSLVDIFTPIINPAGEVTNIIKVQVRLDSLWDLLSEVKVGRQGYAYVVDDEGRLIAHPDSSLVRQAPNYSEQPLIKQLLSQSPGQFIRDVAYTNPQTAPMLATGTKISGFNWIVAVEQPTLEAYAPLQLLRNSFFITIGISIVILSLISFLISHHISQPIKALQQSAELLSQGHLETQVNIHTGDEIQDLAHSYNTMAAQLKNSIFDLHSKIDLLEQQKTRLDQNATLLLRRDLDLREINDQLEIQKESAITERDKLQVVLSGITDGVLAVDAKKHVMLVNSAAENIIGKRTSQIIGSHLDQIIQLNTETGDPLPSDIYCPSPSNNNKDLDNQSYENLQLTHTDGKTKYISLIATKMRERSGLNVGYLVTFHDKTDEKELEKMKLDFVSMAAHELRTPLTTILGYLKFLQKDITMNKLTPSENEYINNAFASSLRLNKLIESLLVVSKIEQGHLNIHPHTTDLKSLTTKICQELSTIAKAKGLEIITDLPEELPHVIGDEVPLEEVISNLISNAINYTNQGTITVTLKIENDSVVTSVRDTGVGITEEAQAHLFTKFFRAKGDLQAGPKGTGLGLYITKKIIDSLNGKIWLESKVQQGTTFYFSLPIATEIKNT